MRPAVSCPTGKIGYPDEAAAAAQAATTGLATSTVTFSTGCVDGYHENSVGNWACEVDGRIPRAAG